MNKIAAADRKKHNVCHKQEEAGRLWATGFWLNIKIMRTNETNHVPTNTYTYIRITVLWSCRYEGGSRKCVPYAPKLLPSPPTYHITSNFYCKLFRNHFVIEYCWSLKWLQNYEKCHWHNPITKNRKKIIRILSWSFEISFILKEELQ
jgi:hypothetical protein